MTCLPLDAAMKAYGQRLLIAACGAVKKANTDEVRIVFDGSNTVHLDHRIRVRDRVKLPTIGDLRAVVSDMAGHPGARFCLLFDVRKARFPAGRTRCMGQRLHLKHQPHLYRYMYATGS